MLERREGFGSVEFAAFEGQTHRRGPGPAGNTGPVLESEAEVGDKRLTKQ